MKIAIANDHAAVDHKFALIKFLESEGHEVINFGTNETASCDYPDYAKKVTGAVVAKQADFGILLCGTGVGMSIVANKVKGIRASLCDNSFVAEMTRRHNNSNVLCLGARVIGVDLMFSIVKTYLSTPFDEVDKPGKHTRRINKMEEA